MKKLINKTLVVSVILIVSASIGEAQRLEKLTVVKVKDGDTVVAVSGENKRIEIRLHGVDSPDRCQPFYQEAKEFASNQLLNKNIMYLETDIDRFERSVGEIYIQGADQADTYDVWFNQVLVEAGLAWYWSRYSNSDKLQSAQSEAQQSKRGLWHESHPTPPWEFRQTVEYKNCKTPHHN